MLSDYGTDNPKVSSLGIDTGQMWNTSFLPSASASTRAKQNLDWYQIISSTVYWLKRIR